ncbi:MAG: ribosomal RNA small subunit methyltransferase A [Lentisphaeria bacterium]|nr:ribosomal RNA small subunit methyltransferase A [Lentisphaeria bacterium]
MNKQELTDRLNAVGMRPGRGLGQNFLLDGNLLEWIVRKAAPRKDEEILEVGPGFGALTERLVASGARITAIEYDHRLADELRRRFAGTANFRLVEADACKVNFGGHYPEGSDFRCVANLPYSISSVFIADMVKLPSPPSYMLFMLQKEMGERLAAPPSCKAYGALTVVTRSIYDVTIEKIVPPEVFFPRPEVDSALVSFKRHGRFALSDSDRKHLSTVVRLLFNQRRKQMGKVLRGVFPADKVDRALDELAVSREERPDKLPVETLIELSSLLYREEKN